MGNTSMCPQPEREHFLTSSVSPVALELASFFAQDIDGKIYRIQMGTKVQHGQTQGEPTFDHRRRDEDTPVSLHRVDQPSVKCVRISVSGEVAERNDREVRRRSDLETV